jgi:hypothetical protein
MAKASVPMKRLSCVALALYGLVACGLPPPARQRAPEGSLCELLERVGRGDRLPGTVSGIYQTGYEGNFLYDPNHPLCRLDVAPTTEARFGPSARLDEGLEKAFKEDHRAYVTVRGVLWGPPAVKAADDSSLPEIMVVAGRVLDRYGHLGASRTFFVVSDILRWRRVPPEAPWPGQLLKPRPVSAIPEVVAAAVPGYPRSALFTQTQGSVLVEVTVKKGKVAQTRVISGDQLLAPSVVDNIKTWRFKEDADATFSTTYSFMLELRETGSDKNPRIELRLPLSVKITAPRDAW